MTNSKSHFLLFAPLLFVLVLTLACGGGGNAGPNPPAPPTNAVTSVTVTPNPVTLNAGQTQQFAATIDGTGTFSTTVTWFVNGVVGGNTTQGTISSTGLYTAPNPSPGPVTITATSTFDTAKSGTAQVTVNNPPPPANGVTSVTVSPNAITLNPGQTQQFTAVVNGTGTFSTGVTWSVNSVGGGNAKLGTISAAGFYKTPYPAPALVTITATSSFDTTKSGTSQLTLTAPAVTAGPALTVDVGTQTHAISLLIYGVNAWSLALDQPEEVKAMGVTVDRWGGNATTRYNYKIDVANSGSDWFFEQQTSANNMDNSKFNQQVLADQNLGAKTVGTVPVIGWTPNPAKMPAGAGNAVCGFSVLKYGPQQKTDPWHSDCGNGVKTDGTNFSGNDPLDTSIAIDETWSSGWIQYLVGKFGDAAHGGIAIYSLDNEPSWWFSTHRDVHPLPFTYDEVTNNGLKVAKAVKAADPTAAVTGPVLDFWPSYFYSMKDITSGWSSAPNWVYNGNPVDRMAHGNVPMIEYYLQQFKAAQDADSNHTRFLDYLDLHTYFAANNAAFSTAGTTDQQSTIINSTRVFWDSTYTDPNYTDPNDTSRTPKLMAPMIIRRMQSWIAADYPNTKTAITEYNWGALEHISGAIAQADILGIFGREGLDMGTLWGPPDPKTQVPGVNAFKVFRNYDGNGAKFGDLSLAATSADEKRLSVYAALRSADNVVTLVVINKTFGDLKGDVTLANLTRSGGSKVFRYSNADLTKIVELPDVTVTAPPPGSTTSTIGGVTFPAMSITVFAVPKN